MQVKHLTQYDLSKRWGISLRTLERWRWQRNKERMGPPYMKIGGRIYYRESDVVAFEQNHMFERTDRKCEMVGSAA